MEDTRKIMLFEQVPVPRAVAQLAVPTILSSLVMVLYNLADTWMVDPSEEADPLPSWPAVNPEKNNSSGFSGYPIGFRACSGTDIWMHALYSAGWWTSTESSNITGLVLATRMYSTDPYFRTNSDFNPGVGLTVRCLKD